MPYRAAIVTVGTELTDGLRLDLNTRHIAASMSTRGIHVTETVSTPDDRDLLADVLRRLLDSMNLVVVTGGLGPTHDDITREAAAAATGLELVSDPRTVASLRRVAERHADPEAARRTFRMAEVLAGSQVIAPVTGAAPGLVLTVNGCVLALLPGPPREMHPMLEDVLSSLPVSAPTVRELGFSAMTESDIQVGVMRVLDSRDDIGFTILAGPGDVRVVLRDEGAGSNVLDSLADEVAAVFPENCYTTQGESLPGSILRQARDSGLTLSCAESCTGGLVSAALTEVPGASAVFMGCAVTYSDQAKTSLLGVDPAVLAARGAVSGEVAILMARGARERFCSDVAVAVTGIAGPEGGTEDKPVGLVWFAVTGPSVERSLSRRFPPTGRALVRERATATALDLLRRALTVS